MNMCSQRRHAEKLMGARSEIQELNAIIKARDDDLAECVARIAGMEDKNAKL